MEIAKNIHIIDNFYFDFLGQKARINPVLIIEEEISLIDTGWKGSYTLVDNYLISLGKSIEDIKNIFITHYHPDHIGGLKEIKDRSQAKVYAHYLDIPFIEGEKPIPIPKMNSHRIHARLSEMSPQQMKELASMIYISPVKVDMALKGGEEFNMNGGMRVIHTPGHTPGHLCFYFPTQNLLLSGDLTRFEEGKVFGPVEGFSQDIVQARESLNLIKHLPIKIMVGFHGHLFVQEKGTLPLPL